MPDNIRTLRRPAGSAISAGRRYRANWPAEVRGGGLRLTCSVVDISTAGACIRMESPAPETSTFRLLIGNVPPIAARPAWRKKEFLGLQFFDEQHWLLESYSQRFDPTAWLKD